MIKPVDKMNARSKMVRIGMTCMGQRLVGAYRSMLDEETGKTFCMLMTWNGHNDKVYFAVHETDEYLHLFFEDVPRDFDREHALRDQGSIALPENVTGSREYQKVYDQLFRAMTKKLEDLGYCLDKDLNVTEEEE